MYTMPVCKSNCRFMHNRTLGDVADRIGAIAALEEAFRMKLKPMCSADTVGKKTERRNRGGQYAQSAAGFAVTLGSVPKENVAVVHENLPRARVEHLDHSLARRGPAELSADAFLEGCFEPFRRSDQISEVVYSL